MREFVGHTAVFRAFAEHPSLCPPPPRCSPNHRPYPDGSELRELCNRADVLVLNWGVHYSYVGGGGEMGWYEYRDEMLAVLREVQRCSRAHPRKTIIWRESTAQHHHSFGGAYPHETVARLQRQHAPSLLWGLTGGAGASRAWKSSANKCMPLRFAPPAKPSGSGDNGGGSRVDATHPPHQWREKLVMQLAADIGLPVRLTNVTRDMSLPGKVVAQRARHGLLYWLPFNAASGERWELHGVQKEEVACKAPRCKFPRRAKPAACEATHFCHTPLLWEPLWDGIARATFFNNLHFGAVPGRGAQTEDGSEAAAHGGAAADGGGEEVAAATSAAPSATQQESGDGNMWDDFVGRRRRCMLAGVHPPCRI